MAKPKNTSPNPLKNVPTEKSKDEEGFTFHEQRRTDGWYRPDTGAAAIGALLGRRVKTGGQKGAYYQIELTAPCIAINADKETVTLEPGQVLGVDERRALAEMGAWCKEGKPCIVYVKALEKVEINESQTFWRHKLGRRQPKGNEPRIAPVSIGRLPPAEKEEVADEDVPF